MATKKNDFSQIDRFKETARQLGCDEDEATFDEKLKVIAQQKLKQSGPPFEAPKEPEEPSQ